MKICVLYLYRNDEIDLKNNLQTKAMVLLNHIHNHEILRASVLRHRIPSDEVKSKILKLFEEGKHHLRPFLFLNHN